jgi:hypothetical protein
MQLGIPGQHTADAQDSGSIAVDLFINPFAQSRTTANAGNL